MRRAGYDVRVLPEEDLGWEENPPTLIEFIRRDQRWCQGTLQYGHFLFTPGLKLVSRFQLAFAMLMFLGSPAWIGLLVVGTLALAASPTPADFIRPDAGHALLAIILVMWFAPKIATVIDVLTRPKLRRAFGGTARFLASVADRDGVLHPAVADHVGLPHAVPRRPAVRPRDRLDRPGARRSHRAVVAVAASVVAAHRARLRLARPDRRHPSRRRSSTCSCSPAGPRCRSRSRCSPRGPRVGRLLTRHRHRPAAGGNRAAARARRRWPCPRSAPRRGRHNAMLRSLAHRARGDAIARHLLRLARHARARAMDALYAQFVKRGDLVFDIGAHVGDRVAAFRRLGARVVAVEPQPALRAARCSMLYGRDTNVTIERKAVGRTAGDVRLMVNIDNPTVSTASDAFIHAAQGAPGWQGQHWDKSIARADDDARRADREHGTPAFIKIDVEGFEEEALVGLTQPVAALSFEFTTIQRDVARACIDRCAALGYDAVQCRARREPAARRLALGRDDAAGGSTNCRTRPTPETSMRCGRELMLRARCCSARRQRAPPTRWRSTSSTPASRRSAPRRTTSISSCNRPRRGASPSRPRIRPISAPSSRTAGRPTSPIATCRAIRRSSSRSAA